MNPRSLICPLEGNEEDKRKALKEAENFAMYEGLFHKKALHLQLLAEELLGMVDSIVEIYNGKFWVERGNEGYEIHLGARAIVPERAEAVLVQASSTGVNEAYRGVTGKIRKALDIMVAARAETSGDMTRYLLETDDAFNWGFSQGECFNEWSYDRYKKESEVQKKAELWDELELSVLEKLSDDIVVSVRPDSVDIVVKAAL